MGNIASAEIAVVVKASDNGAVYKCTASNDATATPLEVAVNLTVLCESRLCRSVGET